MFRRAFFLISSFIAAAGCASIITDLPEVSPSALNSERAAQAVSAAKQQQAHIIRLSNVAGPIMTTNAALCPRIRPYYGLSTHSEKSYSEHIRPELKSELGIAHSHIILHVVPGSPADKAGILKGDIILNEDGNTISVNSLRKQSVPDHGRHTVKIKRGAKNMDVIVETIPACNYSLGIRHSGVVNAVATGRAITVTTGMMEFTNDDELAAILGHELAHNTLGHIRKSTTNYILTAGGTRFTRPFESEADYVGLYYAARAGYDVRNVGDIWRRIGAQNPRSVGREKTHPTTPDRYLRLKAAHIEIEAKRASGDALIPNFKNKTR